MNYLEKLKEWYEEAVSDLESKKDQINWNHEIILENLFEKAIQRNYIYINSTRVKFNIKKSNVRKPNIIKFNEIEPNFRNPIINRPHLRKSNIRKSKIKRVNSEQSHLRNVARRKFHTDELVNNINLGLNYLNSLNSSKEYSIVFNILLIPGCDHSGINDFSKLSNIIDHQMGSYYILNTLSKTKLLEISIDKSTLDWIDMEHVMFINEGYTADNCYTKFLYVVL